MTTATKQRRRISSYVSVCVDLDEFSTEDLLEELSNRGNTDPMGEVGGVYVEEAEINRLRTLVMCGQQAYAIAELLQLFAEELELNRFARKPA